MYSEIKQSILQLVVCEKNSKAKIDSKNMEY